MKASAYIAQSHVRPVLIQWSRTLALLVTLFIGTVVIIVGVCALANLVMHSFWLVLLLLLLLGVFGLALWLPSLLPTVQADAGN